MVKVFNETELVKTYTKHIKQLIEQDDDLVPYLVTVNFRTWYNSENRYDIMSHKGIDKLLAYNTVFYRNLISNLTNNFTRKRYLHPAAFSFVDFDKTKRNKRWIYDPERPHTHSIYLVTKEIEQQFDTLAEQKFPSATIDRGNPYLTSVDAVKIKNTMQDIKRVVSYSSKFMTSSQGQKLQAQDIVLYDQLPVSQSERKFRKPQIDTRFRKERFYYDHEAVMHEQWLKGLDDYVARYRQASSSL